MEAAHLRVIGTYLDHFERLPWHHSEYDFASAAGSGNSGTLSHLKIRASAVYFFRRGPSTGPSQKEDAAMPDATKRFEIESLLKAGLAKALGGRNHRSLNTDRSPGPGRHRGTAAPAGRWAGPRRLCTTGNWGLPSWRCSPD